MGTDIHGIFQRHDKETSAWVDVTTEYEECRDYQLFAVLADVHNDRGFAGVITGEPVIPIDQPRGYPADFEVDDDEHPLASLELMGRRAKCHEEGEPISMWMGDHSHTWFTGEELLTWFANAPTKTDIGIFDRRDYERWDHVSEPDFGYCGGVSGYGIVVVNDTKEERAANPNWTHIRCSWQTNLGNSLAYFFGEVRRLSELHGEIRFVCGFDN